MSDPRHAHKFDPNRRGLCKRIVGDSHCHLEEDALVHENYRRTEKTQNFVTNSEIENLADWLDEVEIGRPQIETDKHQQAAALLRKLARIRDYVSMDDASAPTDDYQSGAQAVCQNVIDIIKS